MDDDLPFRTIWAEAGTGPRIFKWDHYFAVYHRHLRRFRNTSVRFAELGINDGGGLAMWRKYLGDDAVLYGVDLNNRTLSYQQQVEFGSPERIIIEDLSTPRAWRNICRQTGPLDVVVDDASHNEFAQALTIAGALPCLREGGVLIVEDVFGSTSSATHKLVREFVRSEKGLFHTTSMPSGTIASTRAQASIFGIHFYAFVLVVEKLFSHRPQLNSISTGVKTMPNPPIGFNTWGRPCTEYDRKRRLCNVDGTIRLPSTTG